jgi:hypothetical protein
MTDLYLGLLIMVALTVAVFHGVSIMSKRLAPGQQTLLAGSIVGVIVLYAGAVYQNTALVQWLPVSGLIVVGNWFPFFLVSLAAVVMQTTAIAWLRRCGLVAALVGFSSYALLAPLLGRPPQCGDRWSPTGDCVQTTDFTCSAASAATLLRAHGIAANEQEMAELCLTRKGTSWLGLYRGLKLKTADTPWDVEIVRCSLADLQARTDRPMIIEVGLDSSDHVDSAFRDEFGWQPGINHSVVLLGFTPDAAARIIDPMPLIGRESWNSATFELLWRGYGIRLVRRESYAPQLANR